MNDDDLITNWGLLVEGFTRAMRRLECEVGSCDELSSTWFEVLLRLERTPDHRLPMTQLAREVELTSGGFTKVADRMADAGLLERQACPGDRRVTWVALTDKGLTTAETAKAKHVETLRTLIDAHMGTDDLRTVGVIMRRLRDGLDATPRI